MTSSWQFRAFSETEHKNRLERGKRVLADNHLSGCVCTSPELIYYFTGYEAHTHHAIGSQAMVMSSDSSPPILILRDGDVPQATETLVVGDVRPFRLGSEELSTLIKESVVRLKIDQRALAIDLKGQTMNGELYAAICKDFAYHEITDCWKLLGALRTGLSDEEITYLREATAYANLGIDAFYANAKIGISEIELAAAIEYAMRSAGSDYPAVPTWMASGDRGYCQHAQASPRRLQSGDLVHAEFSGVARRYQCVTMGSLVLDNPSPRMVEMAEGGKAAFEAGLSAAQIGGRIGDMEAAYRESLEELGLGDCCPMRFGVGISAAYPPVWENQITIQYECDDVLEPGMAFYIHSSMQSMKDRTGMLLGGSFLMRETGPERLDKAPIELIVV